MHKRTLSEKLDRFTSWSEWLTLILTVFLCTYFIYRDFGIRMIFGYAVLGIIVAVFLIRRLISGVAIELDSTKLAFLFLMIVILVNFARPDSNHTTDPRSYVIAMCICGVLLLLSRPTTKELAVAETIIKVFSVCLAMYVILFTLWQDLFRGTVMLYLSETAREYLEYFLPKGYGVSVNGCTYTNYILAFGMICYSSDLIRNKGSRENLFVDILAEILLFFAMLVIGRRGELLGVVLAWAIMFVLYGKTVKKRFMRFFALVMGAVLVVSLAYVLLPWISEIDFLARYASTFKKLLSNLNNVLLASSTTASTASTASGSASAAAAAETVKETTAVAIADVSSGRGTLYKLAIKMFKESPVFGGGLAMFRDRIPESFREVHGDVTDVHCIYLQFLCEMGIVGAVCTVLPLLYIFITTLSTFFYIRKSGPDEKEYGDVRHYISISLFYQLFIFIVGVYDPNFERLLFWSFYSLTVMFGMCSIRFRRNKIAKPGIRILFFDKDKFFKIDKKGVETNTAQKV